MKKMTPLLFVLLLTLPSFSAVGFGFHWGFDFTTKMGDSLNSPVDLGIDAISDIEDTLGQSFMTISRSNFDRTPINFGGKVFVDILPVDIEASFNFGTWSYDGEINYLTIDPENGSLDTTTILLGVKEILGDDYFGLSSTPYGKLHFDLTLKRTFFKDKKRWFIKPSLGAGASVHFATPVLSEQLIVDAFDLAEDFDLADLENKLTGNGAEDILNEIMEGAKKPKAGMHLLVGLNLKIPVLPFGIYADGKFMIPFGEIEEGIKMENTGFLINTGIAVQF
jgi:hypothetical protein